MARKYKNAGYAGACNAFQRPRQYAGACGTLTGAAAQAGGTACSQCGGYAGGCAACAFAGSYAGVARSQGWKPGQPCEWNRPLLVVAPAGGVSKKTFRLKAYKGDVKDDVKRVIKWSRLMLSRYRKFFSAQEIAGANAEILRAASLLKQAQDLEKHWENTRWSVVAYPRRKLKTTGPYKFTADTLAGSGSYSWHSHFGGGGALNNVGASLVGCPQPVPSQSTDWAPWGSGADGFVAWPLFASAPDLSNISLTKPAYGYKSTGIKRQLCRGRWSALAMPELIEGRDPQINTLGPNSHPALSGWKDTPVLLGGGSLHDHMRIVADHSEDGRLHRDSMRDAANIIRCVETGVAFKVSYGMNKATADRKSGFSTAPPPTVPRRVTLKPIAARSYAGVSRMQSMAAYPTRAAPTYPALPPPPGPVPPSCPPGTVYHQGQCKVPIPANPCPSGSVWDGFGCVPGPGPVYPPPPPVYPTRPIQARPMPPVFPPPPGPVPRGLCASACEVGYKCGKTNMPCDRSNTPPCLYACVKNTTITLDGSDGDPLDDAARPRPSRRFSRPSTLNMAIAATRGAGGRQSVPIPRGAYQECYDEGGHLVIDLLGGGNVLTRCEFPR